MSREYDAFDDEDDIEYTAEEMDRLEDEAAQTHRTLGAWARRGDTDITRDPFFEAGSQRAITDARTTTTSGLPCWMEPFATVDVMGHATVFSDKFDPFA